MLVSTNSSERDLQCHYMPVYDALVAVRERQRADASHLTDIEWRQLAAWNATQHHYPCNAWVPQLVALQAAARSEAVALVADNEWLRYRVLNQRSNHLARYLQTLGV